MDYPWHFRYNVLDYGLPIPQPSNIDPSEGT